MSNGDEKDKAIEEKILANDQESLEKTMQEIHGQYVEEIVKLVQNGMTMQEAIDFIYKREAERRNQ